MLRKWRSRAEPKASSKTPNPLQNALLTEKPEAGSQSAQ